MKPIVVLCSGGFDSVLLLHELRNLYPKNKIHTLFFNYGQLSCVQERRCAELNSEKLGCEFHAVEMPQINWTKNNFYNTVFSDVQSQYLEMRNLIFLSYALSLCESVGADKIYAAFMKPPDMNSGFNDASLDFVKRFDDLSVNISGVHFYAPLMEYEKEDLISWISRHKIKPNDFFTCDTPVYSKEKGDLIRCGDCPDCKVLLKIFPKTY